MLALSAQSYNIMRARALPACSKDLQAQGQTTVQTKAAPTINGTLHAVGLTTGKIRANSTRYANLHVFNLVTNKVQAHPIAYGNLRTLSLGTTQMGARLIAYSNLRLIGLAVAQAKATLKYPLNLALQARNAIQSQAYLPVNPLSHLGARTQTSIAVRDALQAFARMPAQVFAKTQAKLSFSKNLYLTAKDALRVFPRAGIQAIFKATASTQIQQFARSSTTAKFLASVYAHLSASAKASHKSTAILGIRVLKRVSTKTGILYQRHIDSYAHIAAFAKTQFRPLAIVSGKTLALAQSRVLSVRTILLKARARQVLYAAGRASFSARLLGNLGVQARARGIFITKAFMGGRIYMKVRAKGTTFFETSIRTVAPVRSIVRTNLKATQFLFARLQVASFARTPNRMVSAYITGVSRVLLRMRGAPSSLRTLLYGKSRVQSSAKSKPVRARPPSPLFGDEE